MLQSRHSRQKARFPASISSQRKPRGEKCVGLLAGHEAIRAGSEGTRSNRRFMKPHSEFAGKMVVAHARLAHRRLLRAGPGPGCPEMPGQPHDAFEQVGNLGIGQRPIAVPPLLAGEDQP